jgi:predicted small lipoprotein YifL
MVRVLNNYFILSLIVLACAACGVRGPLTMSPPPIKGEQAQTAPAPVDLRVSPASSVLFGADGKKILLPTAASTTDSK